MRMIVLAMFSMLVFRADPESCPVANFITGKFEIYCEQLPLRFKEFGLSKSDPVAHYVSCPRGGYEEAHYLLIRKRKTEIQMV